MSRDPMNNLKEQRIVCAAIRNLSGEIITGPRHYDKIMNQQLSRVTNKEDWKPKNVTQGFVDQYGSFLTREHAYLVALNGFQIRGRCGGDIGVLFSENLY